MAKSTLLTRRPPKKPVSKSKAEKRAIDEKAYGVDEPKAIDFTKAPNSAYAAALTWYGRMADWYFEPKDWLVDYLIREGRAEDAKTLKKVNARFISSTACAIARLLERGAVVSETSRQNLESFIVQALAHVHAKADESEDDEQPEEKVEVVKPTIGELTREKTSDIIGELEGLIDDGAVPTDMASWYRSKDAKPTTVKAVVAKFSPVLEELRSVSSDPDLKEGYKRYTKKQLQDMIEAYGRIIFESERFVSNVKASKPTKKKAPSVEKKLKFLSEVYMRHSKDFNITSIDPAKILGAQELWVFNTRYKLLTVYRAGSHGGALDVARCKIAGFDPNLSMTKQIGRDPKKWLDKVLSGNKSGLKKLMTEITTKPGELQERVNENVILLKIFT